MVGEGLKHEVDKHRSQHDDEEDEADHFALPKSHGPSLSPSPTCLATILPPYRPAYKKEHILSK